MPTVREVPLPPATRALSTLSRIDYADACVAATRGQERTAEEWARAMLEDTPVAVRTALRCGWLALGLRLEAGEPERRVLGWELRRRTPDFALLAASSRLGIDAEVLLKREGRTLLCATFLQLKNPVARAVWVPVGPVHRQVVRSLLAWVAGHEQEGAR